MPFPSQYSSYVYGPLVYTASVDWLGELTGREMIRTWSATTSQKQIYLQTNAATTINIDR